ncbi:hypothetical protein M9H77_18838 [Catharanthus roseus]|uniref:Uncharacterized protein n=1 Tax=Catharanthus roseus TaxID=4058 RepID=A0ACC0B8J8_CATRO|nr:hypothetical protein M9H77_18838 [Catharanthus roseus]
MGGGLSRRGLSHPPIMSKEANLLGRSVKKTKRGLNTEFPGVIDEEMEIVHEKNPPEVPPTALGRAWESVFSQRCYRKMMIISLCTRVMIKTKKRMSFGLKKNLQLKRLNSHTLKEVQLVCISPSPNLLKQDQGKTGPGSKKLVTQTKRGRTMETAHSQHSRCQQLASGQEPNLTWMTTQQPNPSVQFGGEIHKQWIMILKGNIEVSR